MPEKLYTILTYAICHPMVIKTWNDWFQSSLNSTGFKLFGVMPVQNDSVLFLNKANLLSLQINI